MENSKWLSLVIWRTNSREDLSLLLKLPLIGWPPFPTTGFTQTGSSLNGYGIASSQSPPHHVTPGQGSDSCPAKDDLSPIFSYGVLRTFIPIYIHSVPSIAEFYLIKHLAIAYLFLQLRTIPYLPTSQNISLQPRVHGSYIYAYYGAPCI